MGKTFRGVVSAAVEQYRRKANMVAQGDGKLGPRGWPQNPSKPKKGIIIANVRMYTNGNKPTILRQAYNTSGTTILLTFS